VEQFIKYYKDNPIQFTIPSNDGIKLSVNLIGIDNLEDYEEIKVIKLSLNNTDEYKLFTDNIIRYYITQELKRIMMLFSIDNDFIINFY
jgi:hypothetical protein